MSRELDQQLEEMGIGKLKVSWHTRLLMKFWPKLMLRQVAKKIGIEEVIFGEAHTLFSRVERIDLFPCGGADGRGLTMVLDGKTALFFHQEGDHFVYDGFEMGAYDKGDVTAFDTLKNPKSPYG